MRTDFTLGLAFYFLLLLSHPLLSQEPATWHYTDEEGLPSMTIYRILQDNDGYIWLATGNGICRFNGYEFETFNSPVLENNEILQLEQDPWGRIFFVNMRGQLLQIEDEAISVLFPDSTLNQLAVRKVFIDRDYLWLIDDSFQGYWSKLDSTGAMGQLHLVQGFYTIHDVYVDQGESFIIANKRGIGNMLVRFRKGEDGHPTLEESYVFPLIGIDRFYNIQPHKDKFLIFNPHQQFFFSDGKFEPRPTEAFANFSYSSGDQIVQLTQKGVFLIPDAADARSEIENWLKEYNVFSFCKDKEGGVWLGTAGAGLFYAPNPGVKVWSRDNGSFPSNDIFSLGKHPEHPALLVGTGNSELCLIEEGRPLQFREIPDAGRIIDIVSGTDKRLVLGTDQGLQALHLFKPSARIWNHPQGAIKDLYKNEEDEIFVSIHNGLRSIELDKTFAPPKGPPFNFLFKGRTTAISQTPDGRIWIGTPRGLWIRQGDTTQIFPQAEDQAPFYVNALSSGVPGLMWMATERQGLLAVDGEKVIHQLTVDDGLAGNSCRSLFCESDSILWVGTNGGINRIRLRDFQIRKIDRSDGFPSSEIRSIFVNEDYCWAGTPKGLARFEKNQDYTNRSVPDLYFTQLRIREKDTILHDHYELSHRQNNLYIGYTGLGYRARSGLGYRYRMLGLDSSWVHTATRFVRYPSLNPGVYRFELLAINEDGSQSQPISLSFHILTPWWKTIWFMSSVVLCSLLLMGLVFYSRLRYLQNREREKQQVQERINQLKMQALQTQMNPHFIFNALNAIQKYLTTSDEEQAMIYLAKFARLIRSIFEISKKQRISLEEEIEFLQLYLEMEKLRFRDKIAIDVQIDTSVQKQLDCISIPPLLLQPIVENAFKHGLFHKIEKGYLKIAFWQEEDQCLFCRIEDNGVGREKARAFRHWTPANYTSSGLRTTRERLEILNDSSEHVEERSELHVEDLVNAEGDACGTRVTVRIRYEKVYI
ncbi:MAG: histidine kinase [Bacteroidota bacterium]